MTSSGSAGPVSLGSNGENPMSAFSKHPTVSMKHHIT